MLWILRDVVTPASASLLALALALGFDDRPIVRAAWRSTAEAAAPATASTATATAAAATAACH